MNKLIIAIVFISALLLSSCTIGTVYNVQTPNNQVTPNKNVQATPSDQVTPDETQNSSQDNTTSDNTVIATETPENSEANNSQPEADNTQIEVGTVKELVNGDLKCYVTLVDENGTEHNVGATFEICAEESKFLNQKIRATYEVVSVNDCQSAEPCGKSRDESLITKMELLNETSENESEENN